MTALMTRARATTGDALLLPRRRARADAGLLLGTALLLTCTLLALLAVPRLLDRTAGEALRTVVVNAGVEGAVVVRTSPDAPRESEGPLDNVTAQAVWLDTSAPGTLLPATAVSDSVPFDATAGGEPFSARLVAMTTPRDPSDPVRWTAGRPPERARAPGRDEPVGLPTVEVGLSVPAARLLGIDPTDEPVPIQLTRRKDVSVALVTGLYEPVDAQDPRWATVPDLLGPLPTDPGSGAVASVGLHVPPAAHGDMAAVLGIDRFTGRAVAFVDTDRLTVADVPEVRRTIRTILSWEKMAASGLPQVLDAYEAHAGATRAQATLVLAGVGAAAACCLVLAAALLVERRRSHLAGERARGASLASVALRGAVESLPTAVVAAAVAGVAITWWLPERSGSEWLPAAVAVVAFLAPAVLAAHAAGAAWTGRRVPADRRERARLAALRQARRTLVEVVAVVVAVLALVSLRGRGLLPADDRAVDPLLSSTPFVLAVAASFLVVRVAPAVARAVARWGTRSRGLAVPLAATRAQRAATALLPLVTVTVAVALMVLCGGLVQNVRDGQSVAADRLVGADVRLDGRLDSAAAREAFKRLAAAPGVTAVATGTLMDDRAFGEGTDLTASVLVVDAPALARVRAAVGLDVDEGLAELATASGDRVGVLVDPQLLRRTDTSDGVLLQGLATHVQTEVRGTTALDVDGGAPPVDARAAHLSRTADDGLVVLDAAALATVTDKVPGVTRAWVVGPGAEQAVEDAGFDLLPDVTVTSRDRWYAQWAQAPLPAALMTLLLAAVGALALLAVIGLALVVVATSGERGRTLSTLRTLGLDARTARWATLGELAPLVAGGLLGGTAIGLALPLLVGDALGLHWVTAAPGVVPVTVAWWPVLLAACSLVVGLLVAVVVEELVRRRESLGEVLRVGAR